MRAGERVTFFDDGAAAEFSWVFSLISVLRGLGVLRRRCGMRSGRFWEVSLGLGRKLRGFGARLVSGGFWSPGGGSLAGCELGWPAVTGDPILIFFAHCWTGRQPGAVRKSAVPRSSPRNANSSEFGAE